MKALILAAGTGSRLRPLTDTLPKAMAPIRPGLPLLEHQIRHLQSHGVRHFVINLHHLGECITRHFGDGSRLGVDIEYSDESAGLLDTAGALRRAAPLLEDEFLLIYADQVHFYDFTRLLGTFRERGGLATVVVKRSDLPQHGDMVELMPQSGRVVRWHPRPHGYTTFAEAQFLNAGLYALSRRIVDYIPAGRPAGLDRQIFPALIAAGEPVFADPTVDAVLDIGTPEKYAYARSWFEERSRSRRKALFLARDGVILRPLPRGEYLTDWNQSTLMDGVPMLLRSARAAGYLIVVVTNQPQVCRGLLSEADLRAIHERMALALQGQLDAIYYCAHADDDDCACRKPKPGMLLRAGRELHIALEHSLMVGDSDRDVLAGESAGCRTILVRNAYNGAEAARCAPAVNVSTLSEIVPLL